jgi:hypothetical protein
MERWRDGARVPAIAGCDHAVADEEVRMEAYVTDKRRGDVAVVPDVEVLRSDVR